MAVVILISLISFVVLTRHTDFSQNARTPVAPRTRKHISQSSVSSLPSELSSNLLRTSPSATSPISTMPPPPPSSSSSSSSPSRVHTSRFQRNKPNQNPSLIPVTTQTPSYSAHNVDLYTGQPPRHSRSHYATRAAYSQLHDDPSGIDCHCSFFFQFQFCFLIYPHHTLCTMSICILVNLHGTCGLIMLPGCLLTASRWSLRYGTLSLRLCFSVIFLSIFLSSYRSHHVDLYTGHLHDTCGLITLPGVPTHGFMMIPQV